jgi:hypothetical protein
MPRKKKPTNYGLWEIKHEPSVVNRTTLWQLIRSKGFSTRKERKAVNTVFDVMARGVRRREEVDIPGGTIQTFMQTKPMIQKWQKARKSTGPRSSTRIQIQ